MTQSAVLQLEGITKHYPGATLPAVNNVTLTLEQGELLSLLGPSGCGKTSLLRMIAGFEQLQSGKIQLGERVVATPGFSVPPEQRSVGIVFQEFALFPHLTVAQNIAFGLQKLPAPEVKENIQAAIALVNLEGLENRYPHELSGGQQQRVALARALAPRPSLILLDEPLSNLDVQVRLYLREEIRNILKSTGISGVFVTHDQEEALCISDQVAVMRQGCLEQIGTPEEIYREPASRFVAEFVTQANFIPARCQGHLWETEVGCFALEMGGSNSAVAAPPKLQDADLMVRQEDLILELAANAVVVIRDRHFLGREYRYCLTTPSGRELYARTSTGTFLPVGAKVQVSVAERSLRVFANA